MSRQLRKRDANAVITYLIDSEDDDEYIHPKKEKEKEDKKDFNQEVKKRCVKTVRGSKKETKKPVISKPNRKPVTVDDNELEKSSSAPAKTEKKKVRREPAVRTKQEDEIVTIDDSDEDLKPEKKVTSTNRKRKGTDEPLAAKKIRTAAAPKLKKETTGSEDKLKADLDKKSFGNDEIKNFDNKVDWSEQDYICDVHKIEPNIAHNIVSLLKDDNTIPFIARYRKEKTGGMEPEELRRIKNTYDNVKLLKQRALTILKTIDKLGKWSPEIYCAVTSAKSFDELEHIYAPFKPGSKRSLAERAKELGLSSVAEDILLGKAVPSLYSFVDESKEGLKNEAEVRLGIVHIIADVISKDTRTFEGIRKLRKETRIMLESTKSKAASSSKKKDNEKHKNHDQQKYENYFNFESSEQNIKDYQILAINRGEAQKILSVKIIISEWFERKLKEHCLDNYKFVRKVSKFHNDILEESFRDAYTRLIKNFVSRQVRQDLNKRAESASIEVFANNLKKLLLIPPLRGKTVLAIDPGFTHGCKLAVVSHCGNVLDTATIYPHTSSGIEHHQRVLVDLVKRHNCTIVALGNATACRETEKFLTDLIQAKAFAPIDVSYTIVSEAGVSIYSCSPEAKTEFPDLDPNIISAISIARRLQDPLAEFVKVEPKHLGIGMYQHDMPEKQLQLTLEEVITETVSFVGVDVNTASNFLLRRVAGLNASRAASIIEHRVKCGPFLNRQKLLDVRGIGKKSFEQCAGFVRILLETAFIGDIKSLEKREMDYLDQTWIHPESYDVARRVFEASGCEASELGSYSAIHKVMSFAKSDHKALAEQFGCSETSMDIIIKGLTMSKGEDIRAKEDAPLFRKNLRCIDDISANAKLTGSVRNVTNFGAFVDVGIGRDGLVPNSKMKGRTLSLGEKVEVVVVSVDKGRGRILLTL